MPHLLIIAFDDRHGAHALLDDLHSYEREERLRLSDACIAERDAHGRLHLEQGVGAYHPHEGRRDGWRSLLDRLHPHKEEPAVEPHPRLPGDALHEVVHGLGNERSALLALLEADPHEVLAQAAAGHLGMLVKCTLSFETCSRLRAALAGHAEVPPAELLEALSLRERRRITSQLALERAALERQERRERMLLSEEIFPAREAHDLLRQFALTARRGERRHLAMRFPLDLCSDHGRAINMAEPEWPRSLVGRPKALYTWFERELRPLGYRIEAQVVAYADGRPSEAGIFIVW